jgi:hypothetical protein
MNYIEIHVLKGSKKLSQVEIVTSAPERFINEALVEQGLPRLNHWRFEGQTGSARTDVLNTAHYYEPKMGLTLLLTSYELVPVDSSALRL